MPYRKSGWNVQPHPISFEEKSQFSKLLQEVLGRPLAQNEQKYAHAFDTVFRQSDPYYLLVWQLTPLAPGMRVTSWSAISLPANVANDPVEFWHCVAMTIRVRGGPIPPFMEEFGQARPPSPTTRKWMDREELKYWKEQISMIGDAASIDRPTAIHDLRLVLSADGLGLESRTGLDGNFAPLRETHYRRLWDAFRTQAVAFVPEALPIWIGVYQDWNRRLPTLQDEAVERSIYQYLLTTGVNERVVNAEGKPLARPEEPLRWRLNETGKAAYDLLLSRPDGEPVAEVLHVLEGAPSLYILEDAICKGPPPLKNTGQPFHLKGIPAPVIESPAGIQAMTRVNAALPQKISSRIRAIQLKPNVYCRLELSHGATELLTVKVDARHDGDVFEILHQDGWKKVPGKSPRASKGGAIDVWDRRLLDHFPPLLHALGNRWWGQKEQWYLALRKNFPERFVEWVQTLPAGVELHCAGELASLLQKPVTASISLECQEVEIDWFDLRVNLEVSDVELSPEELKTLLNARGRYVRIANKGWQRLEYAVDPEESKQLASLGIDTADFSAEPQRLHALQLSDQAAKKFLPPAQFEQISKRAEDIKLRLEPPIPKTIQGQLRAYQVTGFHFLAYLSANHFGGILADDMGLGKTLQALVWMAWLREQEPNAAKPVPCLVVCPKSVTDNWKTEANRFYPTLRVTIWRGADGAALNAMLPESDLIILNYAQLRLVSDHFARVRWLAVILDEGQYIKNPGSITHQAARSLPASHRLVLSGTPIENRLLDLWSLMSFAMPGMLGNKTQFNKRFDRKGDDWARLRLAARIRPFLLRRTKKQVATELPDRMEEDFYCDMEAEQRTLYRAELKRARQLLLQVQTQKELDEFRFHFLASLLKLRQICCHPALVGGKPTDPSAKMEALIELLEPLISEGEKVLIFSQFTSMLDLIQSAVKKQKWTSFYLSGATENRGNLVDKFQTHDGAAVFLISLKAGGFGLNLTAASCVVLFDPWWNPAVESQAIDRTHRIGQQNKVIAYRLLAKNTIEEKIRQLQKTKAALASDVLGEESLSKNLTLDDFAFLLSEEE